MCKKLSYGVLQLIRTRIDTITLDELKSGEYRYYNTSEC